MGFSFYKFLFPLSKFLLTKSCNELFKYMKQNLKFGLVWAGWAVSSSWIIWNANSMPAQMQARLWACGLGDMSMPSFGIYLNPISTRGGADYAHPILMSTPSFESHRRTWNVHVVHCRNRDSSLQNFYTITLLLSHHKMLNFAHSSQIISEKAILIFTKQRFLRFFIFSFLKTFDCFITDKNILEDS